MTGLQVSLFRSAGPIAGVSRLLRVGGFPHDGDHYCVTLRFTHAHVNPL
jgi:hypothetical protein